MAGSGSKDVGWVAEFQPTSSTDQEVPLHSLTKACQKQLPEKSFQSTTGLWQVVAKMVFGRINACMRQVAFCSFRNKDPTIG